MFLETRRSIFVLHLMRRRVDAKRETVSTYRRS
jgi:hypothetical protein